MTEDDLSRIAETFARVVDHLLAQQPDRSMVSLATAMRAAGIPTTQCVAAVDWWKARRASATPKPPTPDQLARDILSVQPMDPTLMQALVADPLANVLLTRFTDRQKREP